MQMRTALLAAAVMCAAVAAKAAGDHDMAGCGMGGIWVQSSSNGPQLWASSTNQSSGQIYAITTGTSGCTAERGFEARLERERYVAANYRTLSREIARGQGEYVASLAAVMGCRPEAVPAFVSFTKGRYGKLFPEGGSPVTMLDTLESEIGGSAELSAVCTL